MKIEQLPEINKIVLAKCRKADGSIEQHLIRRIKTKDTSNGWQWSNATLDTYFTLEVISIIK